MLKSHTKEALLLVRKPPPRCEEVSGRDKGSVHILHTANRRSGAIPRVFKYTPPVLRPRGDGFASILPLLIYTYIHPAAKRSEHFGFWKINTKYSKNEFRTGANCY